tara:strand:+ start:2612 stop:3379 length:768 start_codon:yes stop_codon:yes gene_type:complete
MASQININVKPLIKYVDRYNPKSVRRAVYMSTNRVGFLVSKEKIPDKYKQIFKQESQQLTLKSLNYKADKNKITFSTIKDAGKGNPPSKYLYPVIGGGSNQVYLTTFVRWLHRNNYAFKSQYPIANLKSDFIKPGRKKPDTVLPAVYANVQRALRKSSSGEFNKSFVGPRQKVGRGGNIQDGHVFAKKKPFGKYEAGIYRVKTDGSNRYISPLFYFRDIPSVPKLGKLDKFIEDFAIEAFEETIIKKLEQYGKSI